MPDFLLLMHGDAPGPVSAEAWGPYLSGLRRSGRFQGGSAIGAGHCLCKSDPRPAPSSLGGYIRLAADSLEQARTLVVGNPVFEAGGTVEIRELPRTQTPSRVPAGEESARAFLPTRDFAVSKAFYEAIGFTKLLDGDVAIFAVGAGAFILQRRFDARWAANSMMQLMVDDLDAWWVHIQALDLPAKFAVRPPTAPALQPWGLRVAYLVDPAGVLWHITQRRANAPAD